jgi:hypothetical protein
MGMTWKLKVGQIAFALAVVAAMALALGADYWDSIWGSL